MEAREALEDMPVHQLVSRFRFLILLGAALCVRNLSAETGILALYVSDTQGRPVSGIELTVKGDGGSDKSAKDGKARIRLAKDTQPMSFVTFAITSPSKWALISPWDERVVVPSFQNQSQNYVQVGSSGGGKQRAAKGSSGVTVDGYQL